MQKDFWAIAVSSILGFFNPNMSGTVDEPFSVVVAGKSVFMTSPEKTCAYSRDSVADARVLDAMEEASPKNQILLAFDMCDNIHGHRLKTYIQGYFGKILSDIVSQRYADTYNREQYVTAMAQQYGNEPAATVMDRGEKMVKKLGLNADKPSVQMIGIIKREPSFLQLAFLSTEREGTAGLKNIMNVVTITKLGVPVNIFLSHPVTSQMSLSDLSNRSEIYTRQLMDINPDSFLDRFFYRWSTTEEVLAALVIGFLLYRFLRSR